MRFVGWRNGTTCHDQERQGCWCWAYMQLWRLLENRERPWWTICACGSLYLSKPSKSGPHQSTTIFFRCKIWVFMECVLLGFPVPKGFVCSYSTRNLRGVTQVWLPKQILHLLRWKGLHHRKLTAGYPKWWFSEKVDSSKIWPVLVSMLNFWWVFCS